MTIFQIHTSLNVYLIYIGRKRRNLTIEKSYLIEFKGKLRYSSHFFGVKKPSKTIGFRSLVVNLRHSPHFVKNETQCALFTIYFNININT